MAAGYHTDGTYYKLWHDLRKHVHSNSSTAMWHSSELTENDRLLIHRTKWGACYNNKLAHRFKRAPSDACPLCNQPDSCSHMLGGCEHPTMVALRQSRHDTAVKLVQEAVGDGKMGGYYTIMDAGRWGDLPDNVASKRLPAWLVPTGAPPPGRGDIKRYRPDILIVEHLSCRLGGRWDKRAPTQATLANMRAKAVIHIVEVGYTSDLAYHAKVAEKAAQHKELAAYLSSTGWTVKNHTPIVMGTSGTLFTDTRTALMGLGVPPDEATNLMSKLHTHTHRQDGMQHDPHTPPP